MARSAREGGPAGRPPKKSGRFFLFYSARCPVWHDSCCILYVTIKLIIMKQYKSISSLMTAYYAGKLTKEEYDSEFKRLTDIMLNWF